MRRRLPALIAVALALIACGAAGDTSAAPPAQDRPSHPAHPGKSHQQHRNRRPAIGPEQAAERARRKFGGRVLNVFLVHRQGRPYYRVRLLVDGRIRIVDVDARH